MGALLMVAGLVGVVVHDVAPASATPFTPVYNSIQSPVPGSPGAVGNVPSLGFQATQTAEFGDKVNLSASGPLGDAKVLMSSWACETGSGNTCASTPGHTYAVPITFHVYAPAGNTTGVGAQLLSKTQTFNIPFRPSADAVNCTGPDAGKWYDGSACNSGLANVITFNLTSGTTPAAPVSLPSTVIWTVSFNTQSWGAAPLGVDGPYNSLNVGLLAAPTPSNPVAGSDVDPDGLFWNTSTAGNYTDGGTAGVGVLRFDTAWTPYTPAAELDGLTLPTISIGNTSVKEGNAGTVIANVPVTLDHGYPAAVTVHYATATGGAVKANGKATAGADYTAATGVLTIPAGQTSAVIPVSVTGETKLEQNEHFLVNLSQPTNAVLTAAQSGNVTIGNDELPEVVVKGPAANTAEGQTASFDITLKQTFWTALTLHASTVANTAASPGDYNAVINQPVTIAGDSLGPQTVSTLVRADGVHNEPVEAFYLQVTGGSATVMDQAKIKANNT
jgi:hypothetical protein